MLSKKQKQMARTFTTSKLGHGHPFVELLEAAGLADALRGRGLLEDFIADFAVNAAPPMEKETTKEEQMRILKKVASLLGCEVRRGADATKGGRRAADDEGRSCGRGPEGPTPEGLARARAWFGGRPKLLPALSPAMLELPCMVDIEEVSVDDVPAAGGDGGCDCYIRNHALAKHFGYRRTSKHCTLHSGETAYLVTTDVVIPKDAQDLPEGCKLRAFRINVI